MARKKTDEQGGDTARRIWLAGIGAYGRAFSEAQESLARVTGETSKMFDDLVARGEEIEDAVEAKGREIARSVREPTRSFDDRIKQMRARLLNQGASAVAGDHDGADLADRLDRIEAKLDALIAAQSAPPSKKTTRKTAAKKKTTRKATTKK